MVAGIQGEAAIKSGRLVAACDGDGCVRQLMSDQSDEKGWNQVERIGDELDWIARYHDPVSIDKSKRARTTPDPDERMKPDGSGGGANLLPDADRNGGGR